MDFKGARSSNDTQDTEGEVVNYLHLEDPSSFGAKFKVGDVIEIADVVPALWCKYGKLNGATGVIEKILVEKKIMKGPWIGSIFKAVILYGIKLPDKCYATLLEEEIKGLAGDRETFLYHTHGILKRRK